MQQNRQGNQPVDADELVVVGRISGLFGVTGWMKIYSYTRSREDILRYDPWYLQGRAGWERLGLERGHRQGKGVVAKLEGVDDREQAAERLGAQIAVHRSQLPALAEDEYYWADLVGLEVVTTDGAVLGRVSGLMETGANDVLVVDDTTHGKRRQRLIPFIQPDTVRQVDLAGNRIVVDWDPEF